MLLNFLHDKDDIDPFWSYYRNIKEKKILLIVLLPLPLVHIYVYFLLAFSMYILA